MTTPSVSASTKMQPADVVNRPRNLEFVRQTFDRHWMGGDPVATAWFNALSLTFPDGERFFIDAVKHYRDVADGKLAEDVRDFIVQEAMHTREHAAMNGLIDPAIYPVEKISALVRERTNFGRTRGPVAMLAVTICLEHFTAILADDALRHERDFDGAPEALKRLWMWHAVEETEHKSVAFDVFQRVSARWSAFNRYLVRARAMAIISCAFMWNVTTYALMLLKADGITGFQARWKLYSYLFGRPGVLRRVAGAFAEWFKPGFHPWDQDNRALLAKWRPMFDHAVPAAAA